MEDIGQPMHFGLNCRHLKRYSAPADWRCAVAIARYAQPKWATLDTRTPVALKVAASVLEVSQDEVVRRAKAGEFECFFPENVAKRITIYIKSGSEKVTIKDAAKKLHVSVAEIEQQIAASVYKAEYLDEHMHVVLITKWQYEKCPLYDNGGLCRDFQAHGGPQIRCLAEASQMLGVSIGEARDELDSH